MTLYCVVCCYGDFCKRDNAGSSFYPYGASRVLRAFLDREQARQYAGELEEEVRRYGARRADHLPDPAGDGSPIRLHPELLDVVGARFFYQPLESLSSWPRPILEDWLSEQDLPPLPKKKSEPLWEWWRKVCRNLTAVQQAHLFQPFDKIRFVEVLEVPEEE